eukprot:jgi/Chlat1/8237/Chrsp77S09208
MIPPLGSLVRYDNAVLVSTTKGTDKAGGGKGINGNGNGNNVFGKGTAGKTLVKGGKQLPPVEGAKSGPLAQTEDILNSILPPREWTEDGQLWVQYVSSTPATRLDVITLQERLDQQLAQRQARETGICPVREELYAQTFDELIRQVTINCAERGLLLLRVRDEMRMTIAAYQTLYESSVAFGMRKALAADAGRSDLETRLAQKEHEAKEAERQAAEWRAKCEAVERREAERRALDDKKHADEVAYLTRANKQLKQQLEQFLAPAQAGAKK